MKIKNACWLQPQQATEYATTETTLTQHSKNFTGKTFIRQSFNMFMNLS